MSSIQNVQRELFSYESTRQRVEQNSLLFYKKINILVPWFLVSSLLLRIFVLWASQLLWTFSVERGLWTIWALMCFIDGKIVVSVFCDPSVYIVITSQDTKTKMILKKPSETLTVPFITQPLNLPISLPTYFVLLYSPGRSVPTSIKGWCLPECFGNQPLSLFLFF